MSLFAPGEIVITAHAKETLDAEDVQRSLLAHLGGDWGILSDDDKQMNDAAIKTGDDRILSKYRDRNGHDLYIITERDRSYTTIMRCEDY